MIEHYANNPVTTLNGSINNSVTSLTVTDASTFPATGYFSIIVGSELMTVTAVSGNTFTVVRSAEGTTAASHASGVNVTQIWTKRSEDQTFLDQISAGTEASLPTEDKAGRLYIPSDTYGLFWNNGSGYLRYRHPFLDLPARKPKTAGTYDEEFEGTADTLPSNWSWVTAPSGSDSWTLNSAFPSMVVVEGTGNQNDGNGTPYDLKRASFSPGSDFGIWCRVHLGPMNGADSPNFRLYVADSSFNNAVCIELHSKGAEQASIRGLERTSGSENIGFGSSAPGTTDINSATTGLYLGITCSGGNTWRAWYSSDGIAWMRKASDSLRTITVDHFRIRFETTTLPTVCAVDWVRYRADTKFPRP
jgi:hypothetical protein